MNQDVLDIEIKRETPSQLKGYCELKLKKSKSKWERRLMSTLSTRKEYKVGDKVKVRSDLIVGKKYAGITFLNVMTKYRGNIYAVEEVNNCTVTLRDNSDRYSWAFSKEMIAPAKIMIITRNNKKTKVIITLSER